MNKLKEILARMALLFAKDAGERDEKAVAACLTELSALAASCDLENKTVVELSALVAQLRKEADATAKQLVEVQRNGLSVRRGKIIVPGRKARLDMLTDHRSFMDDETAARFGAYCAAKVLGNRADEIGLSTRAKEIFKDICRESGKDMDSGDSATGGAFIPNEFRAELIRNVEAVGQVWTAFRRVALNTTGQTPYPRHTGGLTAHPLAVMAQFISSTVGTDLVTLIPVKWGVITFVANEFFRNPQLLVNLGQYLGVEISYAFASGLDDAAVNGDGSATYGGITGILKSANIATVTLDSDYDSGAEVRAADLDAVIAGITKGYVRSPQWLLSLSMKSHCRSLRATSGEPLFQRGGSGEPNTIDDYPYIVSDKMPAVGAIGASAKFCAFGQFDLSHYAGMLGNLEIATSEHVKFETDMTAIRGSVEATLVEVDPTAVVTGTTYS